MPRLRRQEREETPEVTVSGRLLSREESLGLLYRPDASVEQAVLSSPVDEPSFEFSISDRLSPRETLLESLNRHAQLAWVSRDGREAHYLQPHCDLSGEVLPKRFSFVAFRFVKYQDQDILLSWCSNTNCPDHLSRTQVQALFQGTDFPDRIASQHLQELVLLCSCSKDLLEAEIQRHQPNGLAWLQRYFRDAPEGLQVSNLHAGSSAQ